MRTTLFRSAACGPWEAREGNAKGFERGTRPSPGTPGPGRDTRTPLRRNGQARRTGPRTLRPRSREASRALRRRANLAPPPAVPGASRPAPERRPTSRPRAQEPHHHDPQPTHSTRRAACPTASLQLASPPGGHSTPSGGDKTNRYASARSRITSVSAKTSGGHSSNSSPIGLPATACHVDASVGSPNAHGPSSRQRLRLWPLAWLAPLGDA